MHSVCKHKAERRYVHMGMTLITCALQRDTHTRTQHTRKITLLAKLPATKCICLYVMYVYIECICWCTRAHMFIWWIDAFNCVCAQNAPAQIFHLHAHVAAAFPDGVEHFPRDWSDFKLFFGNVRKSEMVWKRARSSDDVHPSALVLLDIHTWEHETCVCTRVVFSFASLVRRTHIFPAFALSYDVYALCCCHMWVDQKWTGVRTWGKAGFVCNLMWWTSHARSFNMSISKFINPRAAIAPPIRLYHILHLGRNSASLRPAQCVAVAVVVEHIWSFVLHTLLIASHPIPDVCVRWGGAGVSYNIVDKNRPTNDEQGGVMAHRKTWRFLFDITCIFCL